MLQVRWAPRQERPDDWIRFHTLANGRQEFRHARDARTARRRVVRVVESVEQVTGLPVAILIVPDDSWHGGVRKRVRSVIPDLEPWASTAPDLDGYSDSEAAEFLADWEPPTHSFRSGPVSDDEIGSLVQLVHRSDIDFVLFPEDLSRAISMYDGGIDVIMRNQDEAHSLAAWLWPWLPPRGWPSTPPWTRHPTQRELHRGVGMRYVRRRLRYRA